MFASAVKGDAPRIAQTVCENFRKTFLDVRVGVVVGDGVGISVIDIQTKDFAQQGLKPLTVALRWMAASARHIADIVKSTPVTNGPIEIAIRPEHDATAVVIPVRLVDFEKDAFRSGVRGRKIVAPSFEFAETLGVIPLGRRGGP